MKLAPAFLSLLIGISVAACNTPQGQNAAGGALLGGAAGAAIGAVAGGTPGAALAGGALGAATGAMVGAATTPPGPHCAQWAYDYYGRAVCRAYY